PRAQTATARASLSLREHASYEDTHPTSQRSHGCDGRHVAPPRKRAERSSYRRVLPRETEGSTRTPAALRAAAVTTLYREARVSSKATFSERPGDPRPSGARERS
ncbi:MAG TPA: hypothetical protein VKB91_03745, partial [Gemmatimonadaceae bacterium]|nr:hypothetical protein [Gemmatimonadaceae bacterium]